MRARAALPHRVARAFPASLVPQVGDRGRGEEAAGRAVSSNPLPSRRKNHTIIGKGTALNIMATRRADLLVVVRLNNHLPIEILFGDDAAKSAMEHLRRLAERHFGRSTLCRIHRDHVELIVQHVPMRCLPGGQLAETLCAALSDDPFRWGEEDILLSVSAGWATVDYEADVPLDGPHMGAARARLMHSCLSSPPFIAPSDEGAIQYRKDMRAAAKLMRLARRGSAFFTWRPVAQPDDPGVILYYEALLQRVGHMGEQIDCADGYAALDRLGMAHLLDRRLLADVLDELENDPTACLSIAMSSQSLSMNLHGEGAGWNDAIDRLKRDPAMARRLVIEIADNGGMPHFRDALSFVRTLRGLGVRIAIAHFGSGQASIAELTALSPDAVKLDSAFMRTAYRSERNRLRVGHLIGLARTMSRIVILDGVESPWHLHLAREEGADWIAGSHLGRPSLRRGWLNAHYGDSVAGLAAFNGAFRPMGGGELRLTN